MTILRADAVPLWASPEEDELRFWEPDAERHDAVGWDDPDDALWPEMVDDRCRICGQIVKDGLVECADCFALDDAAYERRLDV